MIVPVGAPSPLLGPASQGSKEWQTAEEPSLRIPSLLSERERVSQEGSPLPDGGLPSVSASHPDRGR